MEWLKGISRDLTGFRCVFIEVILVNCLIQGQAEPENMMILITLVHLQSGHLVAGFCILPRIFMHLFRALRHIPQKVSLRLVVEDLSLCIVIRSLK